MSLLHLSSDHVYYYRAFQLKDTFFKLRESFRAKMHNVDFLFSSFVSDVVS